MIVDDAPLPRGAADYFDNAATSFPKPPRVYQQLGRFLEEYGASPGRGSYALGREAGRLVDTTRALLAALFHAADPLRIAFTLNATDALNMAIKGVLVPGDHVVTTAIEHNSVNRPLNALARRRRIRMTRVPASPEGLVDPDDVRRALRRRTKLVVMVHGSNAIGSLQPIERIGPLVRERGALFLVDAAQTAGAVPINVEAACVDLLAFPGHKALLGLPGTGGLYVGPRAEVAPWREGGTGVFSENPLQPDALPLRLEAGSPNTLGLAGLAESVRFIGERGVEWIRAQALALTDRLLEGLRADPRFVVYGPSALHQRIAVISFRITGQAPEDVARRLGDEFGIAVRAGLHCAPGAHRAIGTFPEGTVRASPGCFTTEAGVARCLEALRACADDGEPQALTRGQEEAQVVG